MYGLIVMGEEVFAYDKSIMTKEGQKFWVTIEPEGWVPATSCQVSDINHPPGDLKVWDSQDKAIAFASVWKGHPWWCVPKDFEVVEVEAKYRQKFDGYILINPSRQATAAAG